MDMTNLTVFINATEVKLSCEMSEYIRPDEDLQWFRGDQLISNGAKHTIMYENGSGQGQIGGTELGPSRLSTLTISEPQVIDSGSYTCAIRGTGQSRTFELIVEGGKTSSIVENPYICQPYTSCDMCYYVIILHSAFLFRGEH